LKVVNEQATMTPLLYSALKVQFMKPAFLSALIIALTSVSYARAQESAPRIGSDTSRGDRMLAEYFAAETAKLRDHCLADIKTLDDWKAKRGEYRRQLLEMLGLDPPPEKSDLKPVITGRLEHDEFVVEKLHFQSRSGLYVTGNLYLPKKIDGPLPTILYVCGHSRVVVDGVPMGAKAGYQHHGAWYARNGYACLTVDTLQLGEIEGIHHGTHRYGMWWWLNRSYTPAGVEAWNCVRALDYLETRPEIDKTRIGVTGRSGGGAYSWWIAAIDDRIRVAVPTAGITDLQNHVVDGAVEGHCDCMYMVNTYRWDYPLVAALVAPRPLLIQNTDSDRIFPLDGVYRTFEKTRGIYRLFDSEKRGTSSDIALNITPGPHKDTQELQTMEFRWFNHYLKNDDSPVDSRAPKYFEPQQLKVFDKLPDDQVNTKIHETFVEKSRPPEVPFDKASWNPKKAVWDETSQTSWSTLYADVFRWPVIKDSIDVKEAFSVEREEIRLAAYDFNYHYEENRVQGPLRLYVLHRSGMTKPELEVLTVMDDRGWRELLGSVRPCFEDQFRDEQLPEADAGSWNSLKQMLLKSSWIMSYFAPLGVGSTAFDHSDRKQVQNRRRFYLLGNTLDAVQAYQIQMALSATREVHRGQLVPLWLQAEGNMAGLALYAAMYRKNVARLDLYDLPKTHKDGPFFLNVNRYLDMPQALAMAAERSKIVLYQDDDSGWEYPQAVAKALGWPENQIQIRPKPAEK
jgi:dienelactone hydrolase